MLDNTTVITVCRPFTGGDESLIPLYLERLGHRVYNFDDRAYGEYHTEGTLARLTRKAQRERAQLRLNRDICEYISKAKPQALFVFKGHGIHPGTISHAKRNGTKTILFYPDLDPSFGGSNFVRTCGEVDHFFHTKLNRTDYFDSLIGSPTTAVPYPYNESDRLSPLINREGVDVLFVGNHSEHKRNLIREIAASTNGRIHVAGDGWPNIDSPQIKLLGSVYGPALLSLASTAKTSIGLLQESLTYDSHGDVLTSRSVLLPIMGVPIVHSRNRFSEWFYDGDDRVLFERSAECAEKLNLILSDETLRRDVAATQQNSVLQKTCTWQIFLSRILG